MVFLHQITEYQARYQVNLPVATMVSDLVRDNLVSRNRTKLNHTSFYLISTEELSVYLRKAAQPTDVVTFQETLNKCIEFQIPHNYSPTPSGFDLLHTALLSYRSNFEKYYDFMAEGNTKVIPKCDNKPGGLINIFLSKIPFDYGNRMYHAMTKQKFDDIDSFLDEFYKKVHSHFQVHLKAKDMVNYLKSSTSFNSPTKKNDYVQQDSRKYNNNNTNNSNNKPADRHRLSSLHQTEQEYANENFSTDEE